MTRKIRVLEVGNNLCRFIGNLMSVGYTNISIFVPAEVRKALRLRARGRVQVTIELLGEDFVSSAAGGKKR